MADRRSFRRKSRKAPCILIVDDKIEDADATRLLFSRSVATIPKTPDEVTVGDLERADLALVDQVLDEWRFDRPNVAEHPKDGVALSSVLRSHCARDRPTAFALLTGELDGLSRGLPPRCHLHQIARANNVEWVFSKNPSENDLPVSTQALSLEAAMRALPRIWPRNQPYKMRGILERLLALPPSNWRERAWRYVEACHPPIHELAPPTHAVNFVRWMLHSILPYSTFLWDFRYLAARLRVTQRSLNQVLHADGSFVRRLKPFRYHGLLHEFLGGRWWRPGIESWLWELTEARPFDVRVLENVVRRWSPQLEVVSLNQPVVAFDRDLRATDEFIEMSEAEELQPDDWPAFADRPYALHDIVMSEERLESVLSKNSEA
jgi:hypothetical protein